MGCSPSKPSFVVQGTPIDATPVSFGEAVSHGGTPAPLEGVVEMIAPTSKRYAKHHCAVEDGELNCD